MPVTVHKILMHSNEVIQPCILSIGQLSEESHEIKILEDFESIILGKSRVFYNDSLARYALNKI